MAMAPYESRTYAKECCPNTVPSKMSMNKPKMKAVSMLTMRGSLTDQKTKVKAKKSGAHCGADNGVIFINQLSKIVKYIQPALAGNRMVVEPFLV